MLIGVLYALGAGLIWGSVFVTPLLLPDYPGAILAFGRYLAFGLIALPLGWQARRALRALDRTDWQEAFKLSLVGNILYYSALATAIQLAGAPMPTMIIGTLPLVIAIVSNFSERTLPVAAAGARAAGTGRRHRAGQPDRDAAGNAAGRRPDALCRRRRLRDRGDCLLDLVPGSQCALAEEAPGDERCHLGHGARAWRRCRWRWAA